MRTSNNAQSLKRKVLFNLTILIVLTITIISSVSVYGIYRKGKTDVSDYRQENFVSEPLLK